MTRHMVPGELKRVLLVSFNAPRHYSLALPLLKGYAEAEPDVKKHLKIRFIDIPMQGKGTRAFKKFAKAVLMFRPQLIGFSCSSWNAMVVRKYCRLINRIFPKTHILLGGMEICPPIDEIKADYLEANMLIEGEGEGPFRSLLRSLLDKGTDGLSEVLGLHFRDPDGYWHYTGEAPRIENLDTIPSPILSGTMVPPLNSYFGAIIEYTRGCPNQCGFCIEAERYRKIKSFSLERIKEELQYLFRSGYRRFHFLAPLLPQGKKLIAFREQLKGLNLKTCSFFAEIYGEHVRREDLPWLDFIDNCDIGIQSITEEACRIMRRPFNFDRFLEGYQLLKEAGKKICLQLIIGLPGDTLSGFYESVKFAVSLEPDLITMNTLCVLRGTPLRRNAGFLGLKYQSIPPYYVTGCNSFPAEDIKQAKIHREHIYSILFPSFRAKGKH